MKNNAAKIPYKAFLGLAIAATLISGMVGIGTWAYFSDTGTAADNVLAAGTLDLKTNDADGVTQTLVASNLMPGETLGPETVILKNSGSLGASSLDIDFNYAESDDAKNPLDRTADDTAAMIEVTTLNYNSSSLLGSISDTNANGYRDVQDLKNSDLSGRTGIAAGSSKAFEIAVKARNSINGDFQADGIVITITFTLNQ
jgi:predicted ribosomally synthesized peptide with SipW-like signal peptide